MNPITKAIEAAKQNPNSEYASELRRRIESGQLDKELSDAGLSEKFSRPKQSSAPQSLTLGDRLKEAGGDVVGIGKDIIAGSQKRADNISEIRTKMQSGEQGAVRSIAQTTGQLAGAGADAIGAFFKGGANLLLSDKNEKDITDVIGKFGAKVMADPNVQNIVNKYNSLPEAQQRDIDALGGVVSLVGNFIGGEVATTGAKAATAGVKTAGKAAASGVDATITAAKQAGNAIADSGIVQTGKELIQRVPRAAKNIADDVAEAGVRAERIKTSTPAVAEAIQSNLDDRIINTVTQADKETIKSFRDVVKLAEESPKTIGTKKQPTVVGGELAAQQYDIINKQKKAVGSQLGEKTKQLSKTERLDMRDSFNQVDSVLGEQGIVVVPVKNKGFKLNFKGSKYTPAERTKIQQLYTLATEGGDTLSPAQIRQKDQLFSKLKRESNFEGVGDLIVDTSEGTKSLFNVFRDIYSTKLDTISPEIKKLNSQYRSLANLTDDIENSIFKTPNFEVVKSVDPAEFAKVNLRRIFGESQSSPVFEGVADAMDAASRGMGYKGASPKAVAEFAQEMRKLFPEIVPKTGFTGGIKMGVGDIVEKVSKLGAPALKDQQQALIKLLDSLTNK